MLEQVHQCILAYPLLLHPQSKMLFCPKVVIEYSPIFGTLVEQRLHEMQFQKVKIFSLQQTEFLKQDDLVDKVGYLLLEMNP